MNDELRQKAKVRADGLCKKQVRDGLGICCYQHWSLDTIDAQAAKLEADRLQHSGEQGVLLAQNHQLRKKLAKAEERIATAKEVIEHMIAQHCDHRCVNTEHRAKAFAFLGELQKLAADDAKAKA